MLDKVGVLYALRCCMKMQCCWLVLCVVSCTSVMPKLEEVRVMEFPYDTFKEQLRVGYLRIADKHWKEFHVVDAMRYGRKVRTLVRGMEPELENLYDRDIPLNQLNELLEAKYFLESSFLNGAKKIVPIEAAQAQLNFDCWVDNADVRMFVHGSDDCKKKFYDVKKIIANATEGVRVAKDAVDQEDVEVLKEKLEQEWLVKLARQKEKLHVMPDPSVIFFRFNDSKIGVTGKSILEKVSHDIRTFKPRMVVVSGNADSKGGMKYNYDLGMKRAKEVARYLVDELGVKEDILDVRSYGENNPRLVGSDDGGNVRNRYVEVVFLKDNRMYYD